MTVGIVRDGAAGCRSSRVMGLLDDSNNVAVAPGWDTLENMRAGGDDAGLQQMIEEAGLLESPCIGILKAGGILSQ